MSTLNTTNITNGTDSITVEGAVKGSAKAWVNFNGTGVVAIRASFNVSSITDNGTGDYTVNFTTAMPDINYSVAGTSKEFDATTASAAYVVPGSGSTLANTFSTSSIRIGCQVGTTKYDCVAVSVAIFR